METITKKKLQQMLNAADLERGNKHDAVTNGFVNNQYHQKTRLYGDYVRAQDPDMFNAIYREFLNGSRPELNKYL